MKSNVLIVHVSNAFGGAEHSLLDMLSALDCCAATYKLALNPETILYHKAISSAYRVFPLPVTYYTKKKIRSMGSLGHVWKTSFRIYQLCHREKIQTVYCNTHRTLLYMGFVKIAGLKIVCSCRDNIKSRPERLLFKLLNPLAIAVSAHIERQLYFLPHVSCLHNGVRVPQATTLPAASRPHPVSIGYIAHIIPWKNQRDFIRIAEQIVLSAPRTHFYIIGKIIDEAYYRDLLTSIEQSGLQGHLTFTGQVDSIGSYLNRMDILLHTAIDEPFGRAIVEAMQCEKPVIAYACGGPTEVIRQGETGFLVPARDIHKAAEIALELIENPAYRKQIGCQAKAYALHHFDIREYARRIQEILVTELR